MIIIIFLKAVVEVALMLLLGRSLVYAMSMGRHNENPVHRVLARITAPVDAMARRLSPRLMLDRHMPLVGFCLLLWIWIGLLAAKAALAGHAL